MIKYANTNCENQFLLSNKDQMNEVASNLIITNMEQSNLHKIKTIKDVIENKYKVLLKNNQLNTSLFNNLR